MNAFIEAAGAFIISSFIYSLRGNFGKLLFWPILLLLKWLAKKALRLTKEEIKEYRHHKELAKQARLNL